MQQMKFFRKYLRELFNTVHQQLDKMEKVKSPKIKVKYPKEYELTIQMLPNTSAMLNNSTLPIASSTRVMDDEELMMTERKCTVVCSIIQQIIITIDESLKSSPH